MTATPEAIAEETASAEIYATVSGVSKSYSTRTGIVEALLDTNLTIKKGEFVSILGPSGCGKSTLLMMMAGLRKPTSGEIVIGGKTVTSPQTDLGMAFQQPLLLEWRTVLENVLLQVEAAPGFRGQAKKAYEERARELLRRVRLDGFEGKFPRELSGGMQQRVALCRALIHEPPLLLMDEPFGALDALTREQMMLDIHRIWYRQRTTIVFVTHSISEAVFLSDRIVVMTPRPGVIKEIVPVDFKHPRRLSIQSTQPFNDIVAGIAKTFKDCDVFTEDYAEDDED